MNSTKLKLALVTAATLCALSANATGLLNDSHDTNTTNAPVANGGNAAAGAVAGAVGIGYGQGGAGGSSAVLGSGNSSVRNDVKNTNSNVQGQQQGQAQSSHNSNSNRNSATGGTSSSGGNSMSNGGNSLQGGAVSVEGDKVTYQAQERAPVATAYAAPLTATNGTCMGSSSAGGQGASFGISIGSTWTDTSCDIRYDAEALRAAGLPLAAQARLCQKADIAKAMEAAGTPCPGTAPKRAAAAPVAPSSTAGVASPQYTDPIVRQRLSLPPL